MQPPRSIAAASARTKSGIVVVASLAAVVLLALSLLSPVPGARAVTVYASDTYNRTVANGWGSADTGGGWTIAGTPSNWSVAPTAGSINVPASGQERGYLGSVAVQDVELAAKIVLPRSTQNNNAIAYLVGRDSGATGNYYRVGVGQGTGAQIILRAQRSDGTSLTADLSTGIAAANGATVWLRVQFEGVNPTAVRARAWLDGTAEPATWLLTVIDSNAAQQIAGDVGIRARNEDTAASHAFAIQSFVAASFLGAPPPTPTATAAATATPTLPTTFASDAFGRTTPSGWGNADVGGWWTVVGSPWVWGVSPGAGSVAVGPGAQERAYLSQQTVQDVDVTAEVSLPRSTQSNNEYADLLTRYVPAYNPSYYRVGVYQGSAGDVFLRATRSDGAILVSGVDTGIPGGAGVTLWYRIQAVGTNPTALRARAWLAGASEPSTWQLTITDGTAAEQRAGMVGVQLRNDDTSASQTFRVLNLSATGSATPVTVPPNPAANVTAHWLYVVVDGAVYVYDIDHAHALVKQFPIPEAGKRGVAVAPQQGLLYVTECGTSTCSGTHGSLLAYDLRHDVVAWIANNTVGVDQLAVTPDGRTIYMPHGEDASDGTHSILDASDGQPIGSITTGTNGHNTLVSLDGTQAYLTGWAGANLNYAHVVSTATNQVILNAGPVTNGIRPFTVNGQHTLMFTTSSSTCGFQVLSLTSGAVLFTVSFTGSCSWSASSAPSHGISLSPDETRVYVLDAAQDEVEVYDVGGVARGLPPTFVAHVPLSPFGGSESPCQTWCEREGWVLNDLSGRYVYVADTGNVIDVSTLSVVMTLPALQNTRLLVEVDWSGGVSSATSTRFGIGRVFTPTGTATPTASVTPAATATFTATPTVTNTPTPASTSTTTATNTPASPTATNTSTNTPAPSTATNTPTTTDTATNTTTPAATSTNTSVATGTPTPSSTATPTPTRTSTATPSPTATTSGSPVVLGQDTYVRTNQSLWGTASDGHVWGGDANVLSAFSINGNAGKIINSGGTVSAVLGPSATDSEVLFTGAMSSFSNANLGAALRWTDANNWYKAYITGSTLVVQKRVAGAYTTLGSASFTASPNTFYSLRFRIVGTTLTARVWPAGSIEPAAWMITVSDASFASGFAGLRVQANAVTATITSFLADVPPGSPSPTPTGTATAAPTATPSPNGTATNTTTPAATSTNTSVATGTPTPSSTATPTPTRTSTATPSPTATTSGSPVVLGQDTYVRTNQSLWGTASDGHVWGGDANVLSAFSINGNAGKIINSGGTVSAVLGPSATDSEVLFTGAMSSFSNANLGAALRWTDANNWYKAYITGSTLVVQKRVAGAYTTLGSASFTASPNTFYSLRFRIVGTTLTARVWPAGSIEPAAWMITVSDASFASGFAGLRVQANAVTATITSFLADVP